MKRNKQSAAAEQGNYRQKNASAQIADPTWIGCEAEVGHGTHMAETQKGPEQERSRDQDGAMKECFKIIFCQERQQTVRYK